MKNRILCLVSVLLLSLVLFSACSDDVTPSKTELGAALENRMERESYTALSYAVYEEAYDQARKTYDNEKATAYDLDYALQNLKKAEKGLVKRADFSQLKLAIQANEGIDPAVYTEKSYVVYLKAYNEARAVYENDASLQSEINAAISKLNAATRALEKRPDFTGLELLLKKKYDKALYTAASYEIYEVAYNNAMELVNRGDAEQNELLLAENMLSQAIAGLVFRHTDMTALSDALKELDLTILKKDDKGRLPEERYTVASYQNFRGVYDRANELLKKADTDKEGIDAMLAELKSAKEALVDLTVLLDYIKEMPEYTEQAENFTRESYAGYLSAISDAQKLVEYRDASKEQVEASAKAVDSAIKGLKRKQIQADGKTDKNILDTLVSVGVSSTGFRDYFRDYSAFFLRIVNENPQIAFKTEDEKAIILSGNVKIIMEKNRFTIFFTGSALTESEKKIVAFRGLALDATEFEIAGESGYGAPTLYTTGYEVINGVRTKVDTLTYYDLEKGAELVIRYNTEKNLVIGFDFVVKEQTPPEPTPDENGGKDPTPDPDVNPDPAPDEGNNGQDGKPDPKPNPNPKPNPDPQPEPKPDPNPDKDDGVIVLPVVPAT